MEAIRNCCHAAYTYPISREKLLIIGGGVLCAFVVGILLVIICSGGDEGVSIKGSDVLKYTPLIVGENDLAKNLKDILKNQLKNFNFHDASANSEDWKKCQNCKTDLNRLKTGMVGTQVWTVTSECESLFKDSVALTLEQIDVIQRLISANSKDISLVGNSLGIKQLFNKKISSLISVDGEHTLDNRFAVLRTYYNLGVRILSLGKCKPDDLSKKPTPWYNASMINEFAQKMVLEMNRLGMVIDVSRLPVEIQLHVATISQAPVITGNPLIYNICNVTKNSTEDKVLRQLKDKKGLMMVSFNPTYITGPSKDGADKNVTLDNLIAQMICIKNTLGPEFIGIGGGFDGFDKTVNQLENPSKMTVLFDNLYKGGNKQPSWTIDELKSLAGNNFLRVLELVENKAQQMQNNPTANPPNDGYIPKEDIADETCYSDWKQRYPDSPKQ